MAFDSVETWRLYSAEASVRQRMRSDTAAAQRIARAVMESGWWRMLPYRPEVRIELGGHSEGIMVASHVSPEDGELLPRSWLLSLHPDRATERTILHELAHTIAPRLCRNPDGTSSYLTSHGPGHAGAYVEMLRRFARHEDPQPLFEAMAHFDVNVPTPDAWREQLTISLEIEQAILAGEEPAPERALPYLGSILKRGREERGWTKADLARRLSATIPTIKRIENSIAAPKAAPDAEVALRAAVLMDADPIQLTDQLGFQLHYDEQLEQLRALNPGWVALVERLNELKARRDNWWDKRRG